ncbi:MAG TPA: alpha/beta fold hydrolase [Candidatus Baltobacteraceae bacterium]|jgi:hypothetical protein|nr:alpha/beta fold hydrolase [Candidatus Baltobacteraceae bacterium]
MMKRARFIATAGSIAAMAAIPVLASASESGITLVTPTGPIYGTLALPDGAGPFPVVLIIAGSGPTDRDGNNPMLGGGNTYKLLAAALAKRGIASVRYDKRGIGQSAASAPSQRNLRFDMYVEDAAAWLRQLKNDRRFTRVVVAGHSEGSLIGMIAAQRAPADAFVSLEGAGRRGSVVLLEQLKKQLTPTVYAQTESVVNTLASGKTAALPAAWPQGLRSLFDPSIQPYLISWFAYDPQTEIHKLRIPVTIVQGTADVQVSMTDADALKDGSPRAKLVLVAGMNHVLRYDPDVSSMQAVIKGYQDPTLPIEPAVTDAIVTAAK